MTQDAPQAVAWSAIVAALAVLGIDPRETAIHEVHFHPMTLEVVYAPVGGEDGRSEFFIYDMER